MQCGGSTPYAVSYRMDRALPHGLCHTAINQTSDKPYTHKIHQQAKVNEINSDEIAQLVKVVAAKSNNLNSVLGTPVVEGENRFPKGVL